MKYEKNKIELKKNGYSVLSDFYSETEISQILASIVRVNQDRNSAESKDLYAIRQLIKNVPELNKVIFNKKLTGLLTQLSHTEYFLTKAIYFDKPSDSNWFVAYHQDLSVSVNGKAAIENYSNWTYKNGQYGVQPPVKILEDTITIRIHLDKTTKDNGALKVIPKSHLKGIIRPGSNKWNVNNNHICEVAKGGIMLMKPLTLHASNRTTNGQREELSTWSLIVIN